MRSILTILLLTCSLTAFTQFASPGAVWHFSHVNPWMPHINVNRIVAAEDTLIQGRTCRVLYREYIDREYRRLEGIVYEDNDQVFYYHAEIDSFLTLYDFSKVAGDSFEVAVGHMGLNGPIVHTGIVTVNSVSTVDINGVNKNVQHCTLRHNLGYNPSRPLNIIEDIGNEQTLFYWEYPVVADASTDRGLRCYQDATLGFFSTGIAPDCEELILNYDYYLFQIEDLNIWPNPATSVIRWEIPRGDYGVRIFNMQGQLVKEGTATENEFNVELLSNGVYYLELSDVYGNVFGKKFVRQSQR